MSKLISFALLGGLIFIVAVAFNIQDVNARQQVEFIQVSVLAEAQADYGVDEEAVTIPAVSLEIVEDTVHDLQTDSSVRIITFTSLPTKEPKEKREDDKAPESVDEIKHENDQGSGNSAGNDNNGNNGNGNDNSGGNGNGGNNGNGNGNSGENGNGGNNGNGNGNNGNGSGNDEKKEKDGNGGGNGAGGSNEQDTKPGKKN